MSADSKKRSAEFLKVAGQFKLGALVTESFHPVTAALSDVAQQDIATALKLLFDVDDDVVQKLRELAASGRVEEIAKTLFAALSNEGRIFFTGCGATGRLSILLDSVWRDFWRGRKKFNLENRTYSVMSGGDFALIKSVEGFEDFTAFGRKQISDLGVSSRDVVFAITEGGETSFVIGTAWAGVEAGARVFFVYNNPDQLLCGHVERSREVIEDPRIEKINLTTGPMAIAGSTRMQATTIQLCVMLMILEMVARKLLGGESESVPGGFLKALEELHGHLKSPKLLGRLAQIVALEESVYRAGGRINYFANRFGIDVLTDTTERSPTFCTPPFRKFDDPASSESWAFLFLSQPGTAQAWRQILQREPRCLEWSDDDIRRLVGEANFPKTAETIRKIGCAELMRFKIGLDGLPHRLLKGGDAAIAIIQETEDRFSENDFSAQLRTARQAGAKTGTICFCSERQQEGKPPAEVDAWAPVVVPRTDLLFDGISRVAVKMVMNAISTCGMVRLGRVMGNMMIYVVPTNLKLIDRATRYLSRLTGWPYDRANELLFEVIEYIEPRMKSDRAYPPVVGLAVLRARRGCSNETAETLLQNGKFCLIFVIMSPDDILLETEERMIKTGQVVENEFAGVRTGKASPSLVENIVVEVYGSQMRVRELAGITTPEPRQLLIQPWDITSLHPIEKAIQKANLGLSPAVQGKIIRLSFPELSQERRQEFVKIVKKMAEDGRIAVRHVRRDALELLKKTKTSGGVGEEELESAEKEIQKLTDQYIAKIDEQLVAKEKEIMTV